MSLVLTRLIRSVSSALVSKRLAIQSTNIHTLKDVKENLAKIMSVPKGYQVIPFDRSHLLPLLPESQDELPVRSMQDSYDEVIVPLRTDLDLQDTYTTRLGTVRFGRIMEEMDLFAVWLSLKHIDNPKQTSIETPYNIVTASVDEITLADEVPKSSVDLRMSGKVVWAGRTSMEVRIEVHWSPYGNEWARLTTAHFIMAARNCTSTSGAFVNRLVPSGPEEEQLYKSALSRRKKRETQVKMSLLKYPPTAEEQEEIHKVFINTIYMHGPELNRRYLPPNGVWLEDTRQTNLVHPQPMERNHHNTVFGGLLMRLAIELSYATAFIHGGSAPTLCHISDIHFKSPVSLNSIIKMTCEIVYTQLNFSDVVVYCEKYDLDNTQVTQLTNVFNFTYRHSIDIKEVIPNTYRDSMSWLEGRRRFQYYTKMYNRNCA